MKSLVQLQLEVQFEVWLGGSSEKSSRCNNTIQKHSSGNQPGWRCSWMQFEVWLGGSAEKSCEVQQMEIEVGEFK